MLTPFTTASYPDRITRSLASLWCILFNCVSLTLFHFVSLTLVHYLSSCVWHTRYVLDPSYDRELSWPTSGDDNFVYDNPSYYGDRTFRRTAAPSAHYGTAGGRHNNYSTDVYGRGPLFSDRGAGGRDPRYGEDVGGFTRGVRWDDTSEASIEPDGAWFWENEAYA